MTLPAHDTAIAATAFARLPILDGKRAIVGWELVDNGGGAEGPGRDSDLLLQALALQEQGALGSGERRRLLFVRCDARTVASGHLEAMDPHQAVIEVALPPQAEPGLVDEVARNLAVLRALGLRFAFPHEALASHWKDWLAHASYLKIDVARLPPAALPALVKVARTRPQLQLIAGGITRPEQQAEAAALGLDWFQGRWFTEPVWVRSQVMRPSQAMILEMIGLIQRGAEVPHIEALLKRDPALSFNLLRFINSSGFGLSCEITSFGHAVMILGMDRLLRWACLLVAGAHAGAAPAIGQTAVVRGRLMELLADELLPPEQCDHAFVAGVFSLLDAMTGVPLPRALDDLPLPDAVRDVLLSRHGVLAPFLELAQACEAADDAAFARAAGTLQLSSHQVNMAHLEALAWAEELLAA